MAEAQAALRAMLAAGTDDGLVAMDLATLLQQDGKPAEAVAVFEKAARPDPPDYALLAATRAYRDLRRYDDAARLARQGMQRFPNDTVWPLILSLVLSDDGKCGRSAGDPAPACRPARACRSSGCWPRPMPGAGRAIPSRPCASIPRRCKAAPGQPRRAASRRRACCRTWAHPLAPR